jgi:mono/diheme cytochrome c family protein
MKWIVAAAFACGSVACTRAGGPSAAAGRALYAENGCVSCHGPGGRGDGPVGRTLSPRPRDFTDDAAYVNGGDPAAIATTLAHGIDRDGAKMPAFAHLTDDERMSLALFVRFLHDATVERSRP